MHPYLLVPMLACVGCAASAGMLLARTAAYGTSRAAAQMLVGGAFWALCEVAWNVADDPETALYLVRASAVGWMWLGPSVAQLFLELDPEPHPERRRFLRASYAAGLGLLALDWFTPWMHPAVVRTSWGWAYEIGPAFPAFYLFTMANVLLGFVWGRTGYLANTGPGDQRQGVWLGIALGVPIVVASVTDALLPMLGYQTPRLGSFSLAVLGLILSGNILYFGYSMTAPWTFRQEMLSILPEGVALLGLDGRVRTANAALAGLLGVGSSGLQGLAIREVIPEAPLEPPREVRDLEARLRRADGPWIPVALSSTVVRDRRDAPIGLVLVVRDLTEVVGLRNRLITSGRLAAVGELAASIAHEVNNPLAFIRTNLSLLGTHWKTLADAADPARVGSPESLLELVREGEELIEESLEGVERTASFVRDVKGLSRAAGDALQLEDLNELVRSVLRVAAAQNRKGARIEADLGELPLVRCSRQELKQVVLNLVINAIQAIHEGGRIVLRTRAEAGSVVIAVEDDGPGIPAEHLDRIYDPFFTTKPEGEGTGLGLAISAEIVRRHEGRLEVVSAPAAGACFRIVLAAAADDAV
ncbi:MAG TPA: ATP-binding protein [Myxococcota bacterium]|nr:ATP-binding protein [Myxococcota bacterium]